MTTISSPDHYWQPAVWEWTEGKAIVKTSRRTKFRIAAFIVAITTLLVSPGSPPGKLFEPAQRPVLASGKMITLKVTPEGERPLCVSQLEGGLIKIGKEGKTTYTFSPTVIGPDGGTVAIKVFSDDKVGGSGEVTSGLKEARTLVVAKEGNKYLAVNYEDSDSSFKIEVVSVKTGPWSVDGPLTALNYADASDRCCLSCGDREICGYAISTACGGCYDVRWGELFLVAADLRSVL
jgi:hypothetical protein